MALHESPAAGVQTPAGNGQLINEESVHQLIDKISRLRQEIGKVIIGQERTVEQLLVSLLAGGHCLLEGVPGLAKTLMIRSLADAVHLSFQRIQFTPDLMPSDIIGTEILEEDHSTGKRFFKFNKGPIFANLVLADEINRTPPKTQSALLEAMQEFAISYGGTTHRLDRPFFVLATQNPIEQAGTYPLPEAQLDRFLVYINIEYPTRSEEIDIFTITTGDWQPKINRVLDSEDILQIQSMVRQVPISKVLIEYVADLVRSSRPIESQIPFVREWVRWGAGPRAGQALIMTAKARSLLHGRLAVTIGDLHAMARPVFRHRILINFKGEAERIRSDDVTQQILENIPEPRSPLE